MEAVETWHAENIDLPLRFASAADLEDRLELIDLERLARVPGARIDRRAPMLWVEGRNLMDGHSHLILRLRSRRVHTVFRVNFHLSIANTCDP